MFTEKGGGGVAKPGFVIDEYSRNYRTFAQKFELYFSGSPSSL